MKFWYAVQTKSNLEHFVIKNLKKDNFYTYIPTYESTIRHARKIKRVIKPLFPNYFFVELNKDSSGFRKINYTRGVVSLLNAGNEPIRVPDKIIESLRNMEDENGLIKLSSIFSYKPGQSVKINSGIFKDKIGTFVGLNGKDRVFVLLNILGKSIRVPMKESGISI
ncbi:MAG: hypothetical protein CMJ14_07840 [Pelagibacterales bacterium]|nr:hypothetical protein [Pelagibacterales bacterium]|tara:strand:+ start:796 stop:1293 length:498 start_codon:yes stop_codon:yes gene_type:complete